MEEKKKAKAVDPKDPPSAPSGSVFSRPIAGLSGLTIRVLIISFIVLILATVLNTLSESVTSFYFTLPSLIIIFLAIEYALSKKVSPRLSLSLQEWGIFACVIMTGLGAYGAVLIASFLIPSLGVTISPPYPAYKSFIPNIWAIPSSEQSIAVLFGTTGSWINDIQAVQWGLWMWPLIYWYLFIVVLFLAGFFLVNLIRKQWVEIERLAFPGTVATYELIKRAKENERTFLWKAATENLWFVVGIFIGALCYVPQLLGYWGIIPFTGPVSGMFGIDLTSYTSGILPASSMQFTWYPAILSVCVFAPMDVLITACLCDFVFRIALPPILFHAGILPSSVVGITYPETLVGITYGPRWQLLIDLMGLGGFTYGLGFFLLIFQWRRIRETLVAAIRGTKREVGEAFSWRLVWIGFVVCSALWIYLVTIADIPLVMSIFMWALIMCWFVFGARLYAELATWVVQSTYQVMVINDIGSRLGYWAFPQATQANFNTSLTFATVTFMPKDTSLRPADAMNSFKVADMTSTPARSLGLTWILMTLLMTGVGLFLWMFVLYKFGWLEIMTYGINVYTWQSTVPTVAQMGLTYGVNNSWWGSVNIYPYIIGGFALAGVLLYLRTIFPWFFINPIGVFAGVASQAGPAQWRLMLYIALALKGLTLQIGGAKAYEKFLVPIIIGFSVGFGIAMFVVVPPQLWSALK